MLGYGLFLNYGLVLMAVFVGVIAVCCRSVRPVLLSAVGALVVVGAFALAGFCWWDGYHLVIQRYQQGAFARRPYSYWLWGNLGALLISAGPLVAVALRRAVRTGVRGIRAGHGRDSGTVAVAGLVLAAGLAVLAADSSGLSKAEVERVWLPFAVWFTAGGALLPTRHRRGWLGAQAVTALAVNHVLVTNW